MKKLYSLFVGALCAVCAVAQTPTGLKIKTVAPSVKAEQAVSEQPEGRLVDKMLRVGSAYSSRYSSVSESDPMAARMVVDEENGLVWVYNLVQSGDYGVWSKGVKEGDVVSFAPAEFEKDGETYTLQAAEYDSNSGTCEKSGDGTFTMKMKGDSLYCTGSTMIAAFISDSWQKVGDCDFRLVPNPYKGVVRSDVSAEWEKFQVSYTDLYGNETSQTADVAFDGNTFYINGLNGVNADACIVGEIVGEKGVFANKQYLDVDPEFNRHTFLHTDTIYKEYSAYYEREMTTADILDEIADEWDAATRTLTMDFSHALTADGKEDEIYNIAFYRGLTLKPYAAKPAAPADPVIDMDASYDYNDGYGYGALIMDLPDTTVNGDYIDHDSLYYCIYLNDATEPMVLSPADGYDVEEGTTEILYDAEESNYNFFRHSITKQHYFYYTIQEYDSIGVQLVYRTGSGEVYRSNIVYRVSELLVGLRQVTSEKGQVTSIYGLDGRRRARQERGVNIVRYSDGTSRKIIR